MGAQNSKLTVYKNELNAIPLRHFNSVEMDLLFAICTEMREKGTEKIRFSFKQLQKTSLYNRNSQKEFVKDLLNVYQKLLQINCVVKENGKIKGFVLFTDFEIDEINKYADISVNSKYVYLLNGITGNFTKFELLEFTELRSSYAKTAFRLLKQYRQTGYWKIRIDDFRELFNIPKSYLSTDITRRVLKPIEEELSEIFKNLQIKKIKSKNRNKIEYLEFRFKAEDDISIKNEKTFRDKEGNYYQKDLFHLTQEEENKTFPSIQQK